MFVNVSERITRHLLRRQVIDPDMEEIYRFGLDQLFTESLNLFTVILLGVMFQKPVESIVFVVAFMLLRKYAGGYHTDTPLRCYLLSTMSATVALSVIRFVRFSNFICLELMIFMGITFLVLAPVESKNKSLDQIERVIYRQKSIRIWFAETVVFAVGMICDLTVLYIPILMSHVLLGLALILASVQQHRI